MYIQTHIKSVRINIGSCTNKYKEMHKNIDEYITNYRRVYKRIKEVVPLNQKRYIAKYRRV